MANAERSQPTVAHSESGNTRRDYPNIIVIVGCGRSGTTYLRNVLQQTLDIGFSGEARFVVPFYRRALRHKSFEQSDRMRRLAERVIDTVPFRRLQRQQGIASRPEEVLSRVKGPTYTDFLYAVFGLIADKLGKTRLGYKCPGDVWHLSVISKLLPTARFIHIVRDGRDVARSTIGFRWGPTNLYCASRYWAEAVSTGRRDGILLGERYLEVFYEKLIRDSGDVAESISRFIDPDISAAQVHALSSQIEDTRRPEAVQRWVRDMDTRHQYICEAAAGDVLRLRLRNI